MKEIKVSQITEAIRKLCIDANYYLGSDIKNKLIKSSLLIFPK